MAKEDKDPNILVVARNRKASYEYFLLDQYEAGLALVGTEVKSLRDHKVQMVDAYATIIKEEAWLYNLHISPFEKGNRNNHDPVRPRKLLLHKSEIRRLIGKTQEKSLTLVPLRIYFKEGRAKLEFAVAKGKKLYDKRDAKAKQEGEREIERELRANVKSRGFDED